VRGCRALEQPHRQLRRAIYLSPHCLVRQLSHRYDLAVITTNQVTDKPAEAIDEWRLAPWEHGASLTEGSLHQGLRLPALGISWANCVNTRLLLSRRATTVAVAAPPHAVPQYAGLPHATPHAATPVALAPHVQWRAGGGGAPYGAPAGGPAGPTVAAGVDGCTEGTTQGTSRKLAVCWSPRLPYTSCHFEVCHDGVRGCA